MSAPDHTPSLQVLALVRRNSNNANGPGIAANKETTLSAPINLCQLLTLALAFTFVSSVMKIVNSSQTPVPSRIGVVSKALH